MTSFCAYPGYGLIRRGILSGLCVAALLVSALHAGTPADGESVALPPKDGRGDLLQPVEFDTWGKDLSQVLNQLSAQTPYEITLSARIASPEAFSRIRLYLRAEQMPLRQALDWLGYALGCRWRVIDAKTVRLTPNYDWVDLQDPKVVIENVESLIGPAGDVDAFEKTVWELIKVNSLFEKTTTFRLEEHNPSVKLVAILPAQLKKNLMAALLAMERPGEAIRALPPKTPDRALAQLESALGEKVWIRLTDVPVREVLDDVRLQTMGLSGPQGLNIGFDQTLFDKDGPPLVSLDLGEVTAREALEALGRQMGLRYLALSPPNGVWLTNSALATPVLPSREFLWENLTVASFAAGEISDGLGGGQALAHYLRNKVTPAVWLDPAAAIVYHETSRNLIAVAPAPTQRAIMRELNSLRENMPK